jgi:hypothetical protein
MTKSTQDKIWQAQNDADTLKRAEEIKMDKPRFASAQTQIRKDVKAANNIIKGRK